ncbi:MFS transporter [Beijerinckia sp. L45]|uniref:MFS transporter n=1 Tax=Beijerinckia sp. L45 TaxID=1641855 RepID=UPI00131BEA1F|nr:MFS transporter [Beijerinckia sp. L45]
MLPRLIYLLAGAGALSAANLYYSQPLLPSIAESLHISLSEVALLPALTQIGFAIGIVALLPLADLLERRRLVAVILACLSMALFVHATAPNKPVLFAAAFMMGITGVVPQLLTPFAAIIAPRHMAGRAVGLVLSGVLIGVLVSKLVAGSVTATIGWRALYIGAAFVTLGLAAFMRFQLPLSRPDTSLRYNDLLRSTLVLAREEPDLRKHAVYGGLTFAAFMTFWSTYAIFLHESFGYGPAAAGLFGIAGLAGSAAASQAGIQVDRGRFSAVCLAAGTLIIAGFLILFLAQQSIIGLIAGVVLLDAGAGLSHAANQTSAFTLRPKARGRINSIYMAGYFLGGAAGTACAATIYAQWGWSAVCWFGVALGAAILLIELGTMHRSAAGRQARHPALNHPAGKVDVFRNSS